MKKHRSPYFLELAGLGISLVGSVASYFTGQVLFATIPLATTTVSIGIVNRRRFESFRFKYDQEIQKSYALNEKKTTDISNLRLRLENISQRLDMLRVPEPVDLASTEVAIADLNQKMQGLTYKFNHRPEIQSTAEIQKNVTQLIEHLNRLMISDDNLKSEILQANSQLKLLQEQFNNRIESQAVDKLQDDIIEINQRFNIFSSSLKPSDLDELRTSIAKISQMLSQFATRRDLDILDQELSRIIDEEIKPEITRFSYSFSSFDPSVIDQKLIDLKGKIDHILEMQSQLVDLQEFVDDLDQSAADLHDQVRSLNSIQQTLLTLKQSTENINLKIEKIENDGLVSEEILQKMEANSSIIDYHQDFKSWISQIKVIFESAQNEYKYKLVSGRRESRQYLLKALQEGRQHLILVCPWPYYGISENSFEVLEKIKIFLTRVNCQIDIGWGYRKDIDEVFKNAGSLTNIREKLKDYSEFYSSLSNLERLENDYPNQFKLKLLGTHEKFMVCDRKWAMIGSHNFLTSGDRYDERELGLWTNDPRIIDELIRRFENAKDLEIRDLTTKPTPRNSKSRFS